jgi:hypothetical protein
VPKPWSQDGPPRFLEICMTTKITVNEKVYDSVDAMPPDVRAVYEQAMHAASETGPSVKHSEIKVMFQRGGSPPRFRTRPGPGSADETSSIPLALVEPGSTPQRFQDEAPQPIEPAAVDVRLQVALVVLIGLAIGLAFWYWSAR